MHYLAIAIVVFAVTLTLTLAGLGSARAGEPEPAAPPAVAAPAQPAAQPLSRADVVKRLRQLADSPPPAKLSQGAMCYDMIGPPERFEYVCPTCGEKTLYARQGGDRQAEGWILGRNLLTCRRLAAQVKTLNVKLDEAQFCKKCSPEVKKPGLSLLVTYPGETEARQTNGITDTDLDRLIAFLAGKDRYDIGQGHEVALRDNLARLDQIFGVEVEREVKELPKDKH